jgi:hypothetical protein
MAIYLLSVDFRSTFGALAMKFSPITLFLFPLLLTSLARAASPAGDFSDGTLTVHFSDASGALQGTLSLNGQSYAAAAHSAGSDFTGSFNASGNQFPFTFSLAGDTMTLLSGGKTYTLQRQVPLNPLAAAPAGPSPSTQPAAPAFALNKLPAGYAVVATNAAGQSLSSQRSNASSLQDILQTTVEDLHHYFGATLTVDRAYQSLNDKSSGGATFTATVAAQPIRGLISCKLSSNQQATIAVVFSRTDTSVADWKALMNPPAETLSAAAPPADAPSAKPDDPVAAAAKVLGPTAKTYSFPDGTGTMLLAEGYATQAASALDPILIKGPANQVVYVSVAIPINTKDSLLVKTIRQNQLQAQRNAQMYRQMNMRVPPRPPPPQILVAEFTDPLQAFNELQPQINQINKSHGNPTSTVDQLLTHKDLTSPNPDWKVANLEFLATRTSPDGQTLRLHSFQQLTMIPGMQGSGVWTYDSTGFTAPADQYDHDKPLLVAMIQSMKLDQNAVTRVGQQRVAQIRDQGQRDLAAQKQQADAFAAQMNARHEQFMDQQQERFDAGQAAHQAQLDSYAQHNAQFQQYELNKSRAKDDFVETIQGTRTILDTQTGETRQVDLNYASGVVDQLNQATLDPTRFVQIPLRDQQDPRP